MAPPAQAPDRLASTISPRAQYSTDDLIIIREDEPCRLLDLPAELRLDIFELVISAQPTMSAFDKPKHPEPSLMHTCHQIRREALPMLIKSLQASIVDEEAAIMEMKARGASMRRTYETLLGMSLDIPEAFDSMIETCSAFIATLELKIAQLDAEAGGQAGL